MPKKVKPKIENQNEFVAGNISTRARRALEYMNRLQDAYTDVKRVKWFRKKLTVSQHKEFVHEIAMARVELWEAIEEQYKEKSGFRMVIREGKKLVYERESSNGFSLWTDTQKEDV